MVKKENNRLYELENDPDLLRLQTPQSGRSWVHHNPERRRLDVHYFWHPIEKRLQGLCHHGPETEGPPGCAHGGSIAALMDDAMGTSAWAAGYRVVAVNLNVNFRSFVPLETTTRVECWIEREQGRKVFTGGCLRAADGTVHAEAEGLFLQIDFGKLLDRSPRGPVA